MAREGPAFTGLAKVKRHSVASPEGAKKTREKGVNVIPIDMPY